MWGCCCVQPDATMDEVHISQALPSSTLTAIDEPPEKEQIPESGIFTVVLPTAGFSVLGAVWDPVKGKGRIMASLNPGAITSFNHENPESSIQVYDMLVAIDDVKDEPGMAEKLKANLPEKMTLTFNRPRKVHVTIRKEGPLGLKLDYSNDSCCAMVSGINASGMIPTWNLEHPSDAVRDGDRFVEYNGVKCAGKQMVGFIKEEKPEKDITLTVLKYE